MNAVVELKEDRPRAVVLRQDFGRTLAATEIRQRVNVIQEVMTAVMKKDVHYGVIPGCKKPSLYKPGSEVLLAAFQIATKIEAEDLSTPDCVRYRVRVVGIHTPSGAVVGEGIGECSSNEEKYKWRKAYDDEFNATPETRRRIKFGKYKDKQVRTEPADVANTILKMAKKRAQIDMTLTATGASDCFEQDVEDLPEELLDRGDHRGDTPKNEQRADPPKTEKPIAPDDWFAAQLEKAAPLLRAGTRKADDIIASFKTKASLTPEQEKAVRDIKPESAS